MKKGFVFLIFCILLCGVVSGEIENYNEMEYLEIDFDVATSVYLKYSGEGNSIEFIKSDLSFFPRDNDRQEVIVFNPYSDLKANIQEKEDVVSFTWTSGFKNNINYGINSKVKTKSVFSNINKKINFPITKVDSTALKYTQATEFIDITNEIENKANEIIGTEDDYYEAVFKLAEWTRRNINYNITTLTADVVQPSSWVLKNKKGVCDEITNLFISLCRSVGIPARFVSGMVYTNVDYSWGAHGWAEVYFPNYGWVPFDVTFGEYGWLDPSHLKLKDNVDSGSATAQYTWKSYGVDIEIGSLDLKTSVSSVGGKKKDVVELEIIPHKQHVKFGSYVPVEVRVKNLENSYLASKITILKSPKLSEDNVKVVFLKPNEEKSVFWIIKIPEDNPEYIYTSTLEVKSTLGEISDNVVKYGKDYEYYSKEFAEAIVNSYKEREDKEEFKEVNVNCGSDKEIYYSGDEASVKCSIMNLGLDGVFFDLCFGDKCKTLSLKGKEKKVESESFLVSESMKIPVIVESVNKVKYSYVNLEVIPVPEIYVSDLEPVVVDYKDEVSLSFNINSNTFVENLVIDFGFDKPLVYDEFEGVQAVSVSTSGKSLVRGLTFKATYKDITGKEYEEMKAIPVKVENIPWYAKFVFWVVGLF